MSYRLLPYLTLAFSHQAYLSDAWHIARHACLRYVILLGKQPNNKCLCSYRISCFSVDILIFVLSNFMISFQVRLYNYNGSPRVLSFTSFPLHVGIVSFSCCSVPLWYTGSLHLWRDVRCQSFNYVFTQGKCELSNRTKEARPEDFVPSSERYYFRRYRKRGEHQGKMIRLTAIEREIWPFFFTFSCSYFLF